MENTKKIHAEGEGMPQHWDDIPIIHEGYYTEEISPVQYSTGMPVSHTEVHHIEGHEPVTKNEDEDSGIIYLNRLLENLSSEMVRILTKTALKVLKNSDSMGLQLAKILVEDAIRYDSIYPYARGYNPTFLEAAKTLGNENTV